MQNLVSHTLQIRPLSQTPFSLSIGLGYGYFLYTQSLHPCSVQKSHRSYFTFAVRSFLQQKHAPVMGMTFSGLSLVLPPSFFSFNLGVPNPKNGIILCEIKLAIANFNVLFSILLEFILVDVRHYFETVRKHVCKLVLVNN